MMKSSRRTFLGALLGAAPLSRALADPAIRETEFFIFIHAAGGWDVTLWADPRNSRAGLVEPATTANTDTGGVRLWKDQALEGDVRTFALVEPRGSRIVFGPGIGALSELADRLCVVNGLAMNTVSHPDGIAFSVTGRHLAGSRVGQPSVNTLLANELGLGQTFPSISLQFPSYYAGEHLDRRAAPLAIDRVGNIARVLSRTPRYVSVEDAGAVTALLSSETATLAGRSAYADVLRGMGLQYRALERMLGQGMQELFDDGKLRAARPEFDYRARFQGNAAVNAAFAVEAMRRNVVRCVSFAMGGLDTHAGNYKQQAQIQQELFDVVARLVRTLETIPHPTMPSDKLVEHTHILVTSEFCRTPQVNLAGGRDHYPNNSALVISPRFRGNTVLGKTDPEQVLPMATRRFADGERAMAPPDLLATFVSAFGVPPGKYFREGEVVPELLRA
jgi:uncharacterized protein (DUF1501 family)